MAERLAERTSGGGEEPFAGPAPEGEVAAKPELVSSAAAPRLASAKRRNDWRAVCANGTLTLPSPSRSEASRAPVDAVRLLTPRRRWIQPRLLTPQAAQRV